MATKRETASLQESLEQISVEEVKSVKARIKVDEIAYVLIERKDGENQWFKELQVLNVQNHLAAKYKQASEVNYSTIFKEIK